MDSNELNKNFVLECFKKYETLRKSKTSIKKYHDFRTISINMINLYVSYSDDVDFKKIIEKLKKKYITGESKIENNETKEEKLGIGEIYDYISNFDFSKKKFNIFTTSMELHMKLYSKTIGKDFGGSIRSEQAVLMDTNIEVLPPKEAMSHYNSYIARSDKIMDDLDHKDIFSYIMGCLEIMTDLIKTQPFGDGNKRTFRSLFNLMMKRRNFPPIYIGEERTQEFSDCLLKAIMENDYNDLYDLYLVLICDSIVEVGLGEQKLEEKGKKLK